MPPLGSLGREPVSDLAILNVGQFGGASGDSNKGSSVGGLVR